MNVEEISGAGITPRIIERIRSWGITTLTDIQIKAITAGIADGRSMIVSAPTSTGKTLIGELAVLTALYAGVRSIYLVSHKALADQKYLDFESKFGESSVNPLASVGLNTGDRAEGDINARLMVATYEKALGLILSGQLKPADALIIADELQIIGESGRGPDIETLCAVIKQRGYRQFVALTATVENPADLAGWIECELVQSYRRDVPLYQQIWFDGKVAQITFGQEDANVIDEGFKPGAAVVEIVHQLLDLRRGPVLVFTESRREASDYAQAFSKDRPRAGDGIFLSEQLDLFSEPTEFSQQLKENAERRVTFHTADLSPQERLVIEAGFLESKFEACFATSTLAAGVNFPFRSIVFPKLTYQWGTRAGTHLTLSDYRNMSGRAGRLGMHEDGYAVLLPRNHVELAHAKRLALPTNEHLSSQLVALSLRKTILVLVASQIATSFEGVMEFFRKTLYWYQILEKNPSLLATLGEKSKSAVNWLVQYQLLIKDGGNLLISPLGKSAAISGLLPGTVVQFVNALKQFGTAIEQSFEDWAEGLIYAVCACEEFRGKRPSRFLPWPISRSYDSVTFWADKKLPIALDRGDIQLAQCAHALALYITGIAERKIAFASKMSSGSIHRLSLDVAWVLDGVHKLTTVPELGCPQTLGNKIAMLSRRVRWGTPPEALDMMRIALRHGVPGFGRQRSMALISQGISTLHEILSTAKTKLIEILRSDKRVEALLHAASKTAEFGPSRLTATHNRIAKDLGIADVVEACNREFGVTYEQAIEALLRVETSWIVKALDDGERQNVPDLYLQLGKLELLIECKTSSKSPPLIKKEDAWAVMQKAADFDKTMKRITLGKPVFDESSKKKAAAAYDITLVEHSDFLEGLLRVHAGTLEPCEFINWLSMPGLSDIERLGGTPTYSL
jgi:helicase